MLKMTATTTCSKGHKNTIRAASIRTDDGGREVSAIFGSDADFCETCDGNVVTITDHKLFSDDQQVEMEVS